MDGGRKQHMAWAGQLTLDYKHAQGRTTALDRHDGPLRVLRALYPEGEGICHHVLVHPPGGIVGGDSLDIQVDVRSGAHALLTTPGATRFYRSAGPAARQDLVARVADGARLEWLPLETLVHDAARATNTMRFELAPGGQMIGSDLLALGLPASQQPYACGCFDQRIEVDDVWMERGRLDFEDPAQAALTRRLLASPLGWARRSVLGLLWFATGSELPREQVEALLESAREVLPESRPDAPLLAGATAPHPRVVLVRVLAHRTEPAQELMRELRHRWRTLTWGLPRVSPRVWNT